MTHHRTTVLDAWNALPWLLVLLGGACLAPGSGEETVNEEAMARVTPETTIATYPRAPKGQVVNDYHGTMVEDPYRWLEDPQSEQTRAWVAAQNKLTGQWVDQFPARDEIARRLEELWNHERYGLPQEHGGRYFFFHNDGLQEQSPLFVAESPDGEGRLLLDPNTFSDDGTVSLAAHVPSPDGKLLAYGTSDGGSDWIEWRFMDVATLERLPDVITRNKFGGLDWGADGRSVVYSRFALPEKGAELRQANSANEVCLHRLGTPEEQDVVLRPASTKGFFSWPVMTAARTAVVVHETDSHKDKNNIEVIAIAGPDIGRKVPLIDGFDTESSYVGNDGDLFWVRTDLGAPNGRLVAIELFKPERESWIELVPEREVAMQGCSMVGGHFLLDYLRNAQSEVQVHDIDGGFVRTQQLPGTGSVHGLDGEQHDPLTWFSYMDFSTPAEIWELDVSSGAIRLLRPPVVATDPAVFETNQVFYSSKDGTRVSMFIVARAGLELSGDHPTLLHGYGGFNVSMTPSYRTSHALWLERGGVLAIPNLRGGGEYGSAWHRAGTKLSKQNVFDDFIAAAEWLIESGYTSPERLAISGGSNGGLLVGACMTQRPDLFRAALPAVGVLDMLRYQLFTIGWAWAGDYGTSEDPEEFEALYAYSPLHNIREGVDYPATLVTTADHDDRVVPAHSYKFAARLQEAHGGGDPILIRVETRAGHSAGRSTSTQIAEAADVLAFLDYFLMRD